MVITFRSHSSTLLMTRRLVTMFPTSYMLHTVSQRSTHSMSTVQQQCTYSMSTMPQQSIYSMYTTQQQSTCSMYTAERQCAYMFAFCLWVNFQKMLYILVMTRSLVTNKLRVLQHGSIIGRDPIGRDKVLTSFGRWVRIALSVISYDYQLFATSSSAIQVLRAISYVSLCHT